MDGIDPPVSETTNMMELGKEVDRLGGTEETKAEEEEEEEEIREVREGERE